jgi:hypothetical protein
MIDNSGRVGTTRLKTILALLKRRELPRLVHDGAWNE